MKLELNKEEHYTSVKILEENLNTRIAPILKNEFVMLNSEGHRNLIVNLAHVKYADSSGISALLTANRLCTQSGGVLTISNINEHVAKVLKITFLDKIFNIFDKEEEAKEAIYKAIIDAQNEEETDDETDEIED